MFFLLWTSLYISDRSKVIRKTIMSLSSTYCVSSMALGAGDAHKSKDECGLLFLSFHHLGEDDQRTL